jgi:anaerobic glycerol-3-phosphate dehydrogenase
LAADRKCIREPLFDLLVSQPEDRMHWHWDLMLDPEDQAINKAGLEVDDNFQPLTASGRPAFKNLYTAGSILGPLRLDPNEMRLGGCPLPLRKPRSMHTYETVDRFGPVEISMG